MNLFTHLLIKKRSSLEIILRFPTFRPKFIVFPKKRSSSRIDLVFFYSRSKIMVLSTKKRSSHQIILRFPIQFFNFSKGLKSRQQGSEEPPFGHPLSNTSYAKQAHLNWGGKQKSEGR